MAQLTLKDLNEAFEAMQLEIQALRNEVQELREMKGNARDRGPASEGEMTEAHAIRVMLGDLKDMSHKEAAIKLKLSYGQIYSARKGYTFKKIYQRMVKGEIDTSHDEIQENEGEA